MSFIYRCAPMTNKINRRRFLKQSFTTAAGSYLGLSYLGIPASGALGANDQVRLAIIGLGWRGGEHLDQFQKLKGVNVVAISDPDQHILDDKLKNNSGIKGYADAREILDRNDIDAVVIATPNHWHSLMTVLACQAGKHVYVEKPVSHSIWEGRKMVETARKYNRIVQAGTQHRSCPA